MRAAEPETGVVEIDEVGLACQDSFAGRRQREKRLRRTLALDLRDGDHRDGARREPAQLMKKNAVAQSPTRYEFVEAAKECQKIGRAGSDALHRELLHVAQSILHRRKA